MTPQYYTNNPIQIPIGHSRSRRQTKPAIKKIRAHLPANHLYLVCVFILCILRLFAAINPCNPPEANKSA